MNKYNRKIYIKRSLYLLYLFFGGSTILIPLLFGSKYNMDVAAYINRLPHLNDQSLTNNILNNTLSLVILHKILFFLSPTVILYLVYIFSVIFLSYILLKYLNVNYVLTIFFICFFSLYLNQSRETISICFGVLAWKNMHKKPLVWILYLLLSAFFHLFAFFYICLFIMSFFFKVISLQIKLALVFFVIFFLFVLFFYFPRYTYYLKFQNYISFLFVLLGIYILIIWNSIKTIELKIFFVTVFFLAAFSSNLPDISSRIAEISIVLLFFSSSYSRKNIEEEKNDNINLQVLIIAFVMFVYRLSVLLFFNQDRIQLQDYLYNLFL